MKIKHSRSVFAVLTLALMLTPMAMAQTRIKPTSKPTNFAETVAKTTTETEEVIVSGRLDKLSAVRMAVDAAEDRFLSRYNELNDDRRFDINCITGPTTGHHIWVRHCEPVYVTDAKRDAYLYGFLQYGGQFDSLLRDSMTALTLQPELQAKMREIVANDAELQHALVERSLLVERYEKLHKKKHVNNWIVWD